jgi:hypothetical protein
MEVLSKSPLNPVRELMAIINSEVPTAVLNGRPVRNTSAGIIKNPPPAPTRPVKKPINVPSTMTRNTRNFPLSELASRGLRINRKDASTINTAKIPSSSSRLVKTKSFASKIIAGMAGTIQCRVAKIVAMEGMPKRNPVLRLTRFSRYFGIAPAKLVMPTMNNE